MGPSNMGNPNILETKWEDYDLALQFYKKRKKKEEIGGIFCESIESAAEASRLRKFLSVSPQPSCLLTKAERSWTDSEKEYLNLLLDTHFPSSESAETTIL